MRTVKPYDPYLNIRNHNKTVFGTHHMRNNKPTSKLKQQIKANYIQCGGIAFMPLMTSLLISLKGSGPMPITGNKPALGIASLVITIPLTAISGTIGLVGALANTVYAAVALPLDMYQNREQEEAATELLTPSSMRSMLESMPSNVSSADHHVQASPSTVSAQESNIKEEETLALLNDKAEEEPESSLSPNL